MWRSLLFMPVLEERFLAKASQRGADAIVLDLEASIAASRKQEARNALPNAIDRLNAEGLDVLVRINSLWWPALKDLDCAIQNGLTAIVLPTCSAIEHVKAVDNCIGELETERGLPANGIGIVPLIETARGVRDVDSLLRASQRIQGVGFGAEDYIADMRAVVSTELLTITSVKLAEAARAADITPFIVPESLGNLTDLDAFEDAARRGRQMGSEGGFCVHPGQVARLNKVFTPSDEEVNQAKRIIAAAKKAQEQGLGAVRLDDRMIDGPIIVRAERLVERAENLERASPSLPHKS